MNPYISVIIATYNSADYIRRCLDSLHDQTNQDFEVLIKDGGSKDLTMDIIANHALKPSYLCSSSDLGVYDAWNQCIKQTNGSWIIFIGSDDFIESRDFFQKIVVDLGNALRLQKLIVYGKNKIINELGEEKSVLGSPWDEAKKTISSHMSIRHPGCFYANILFDKIGIFDSSFRIAGDHHFTLRCLNITSPYFYDYIGIVHQVGGLSTSPANAGRVIIETYRIRKELGFKPFLKLDKIFFKRVILCLGNILVGEKFTTSIFLREN